MLFCHNNSYKMVVDEDWWNDWHTARQPEKKLQLKESLCDCSPETNKQQKQQEAAAQVGLLYSILVPLAENYRVITDVLPWQLRVSLMNDDDLHVSGTHFWPSSYVCLAMKLLWKALLWAAAVPEAQIKTLYWMNHHHIHHVCLSLLSKHRPAESIQFSFIYIAPNYNKCHLKALQ